MTEEQDSSERPDDPWTIKRLLAWTTDYFRQRGEGQARLDAEVLLAAALDIERIDLYTHFDRVPSEAERLRYRAWVQRHGQGEPVAYLVGYREFFSLRFAVTPEVLIPRPETEHLVTESLDIIRKLQNPESLIRVADVGTGSGNIAISIAAHQKSVRLIATDCSPGALAVARANARSHGVEQQIEFVHCDLLPEIDGAGSLFELIVSNPPYVGQSERQLLAQSVIDFEPHQALFAEGPVGNETIERLVNVSAARLTPGGYLLFEISPMIATACRQLIDGHPQLKLVRLVKDLAGLDRVVVSQKQ